MNRLPLLALLLYVLAPVERILADDKPDSKTIGASVQNGWVTVTPLEFTGAINNPLKGFRDYKKDGYGLIERQYIKWSDIEVSADDSVERIIAHTNKITSTGGRHFEDLNIKLVPRVYLDWNGEAGTENDPQQHRAHSRLNADQARLSGPSARPRPRLGRHPAKGKLPD